jgi:hypothetical protein
MAARAVLGCVRAVDLPTSTCLCNAHCRRHHHRLARSRVYRGRAGAHGRWRQEHPEVSKRVSRSPTTHRDGRGHYLLHILDSNPGFHGHDFPPLQNAIGRNSSRSASHLCADSDQPAPASGNPNDQVFCTHVQEDVGCGPRNLGLPSTTVDTLVTAAMTLAEITHLAERSVHQLSAGEMKRSVLRDSSPCDNADSSSVQFVSRSHVEVFSGLS